MNTTYNIDHKDFEVAKPKDLLEIFKKNKNITIKRRQDEEISITYTSGLPYGIRFAEVIVLQHRKSNPPPVHTPDDDWTVTIIYQKVLSPLDFKKAIANLRLYYNNMVQGKKTNIKDLTPEEIEEIVWTLNAPIGEDRVYAPN